MTNFLIIECIQNLVLLKILYVEGCFSLQIVNTLNNHDNYFKFCINTLYLSVH